MVESHTTPEERRSLRAVIVPLPGQDTTPLITMTCRTVEALLDDADALAGALAAIREAMDVGNDMIVGMHSSYYAVQQMRQVLRAALAGPAPESPQNAPRMLVDGVPAQETANTGDVPFQRHPDAEKPGWGALREAIDALVDAARRRGVEIALDPNAAGTYTATAESGRNCEWRVYNEIRELTGGTADGRTR